MLCVDVGGYCWRSFVIVDVVLKREQWVSKLVTGAWRRVYCFLLDIVAGCVLDLKVE